MTERSQIAKSFLPLPGSDPVEWRIEPGLTGYQDALDAMEARADAIRRDNAAEMVWLVEHPPLYTAGTSAQDRRSDRSGSLSRSLKPAEAANTPTTAPASGSPM